MNLGFSIVICTYNGAARLEPTLEHIARLNVPEGCACEVILVDNASTDNTADFARKAWQDKGAPFSLNIIREGRAGKGYAVETGYDAAHYQYLVTCDDDNWLDKDYLRIALPILQGDPAIGALMGKGVAVFEKTPPEWIFKEGNEQYFVICGPMEAPGYFPPNNFGTWGAGTIFRKDDWDYLRSQGFTFLTSKIPGKAAGEDHELGRALLMIKRTFYYSDKLTFGHYMPADRLTWDKLKKNFETFGYVSHYNFLFAITLDALRSGRQLTRRRINKEFYAYALDFFRRFTLKQQVAYFIKPQEQGYQLKMLQYYSHFKWFFRLRKQAARDIEVLTSWMKPVLKQHGDNFQWVVGAY
jgi:glycosyltransferase involved in cell wall biosynthesis